MIIPPNFFPNDELENGLSEIYKQFFDEMDINGITGLLKDEKGEEKRFAAPAYIGSNYKKGEILFIGLDIGSDELFIDKNKSEDGNRYQTFEERRERVENKDDWKNVHYNPHILGTIICAMHCLKWFKLNETDWEEILDSTYLDTIKKIKEKNLLLKTENPLSYMALTNFHKFVTKGRENEMDGNKDRHFINNNGKRTRKTETYLLVNEIGILKPKIIIFQSASFREKTKLSDQIKDILPDTKIYASYHPSYRPGKNRLKTRNSKILMDSVIKGTIN